MKYALIFGSVLLAVAFGAPAPPSEETTDYVTRSEDDLKDYSSNGSQIGGPLKYPLSGEPLMAETQPESYLDYSNPDEALIGEQKTDVLASKLPSNEADMVTAVRSYASSGSDSSFGTPKHGKWCTIHVQILRKMVADLPPCVNDIDCACRARAFCNIIIRAKFGYSAGKSFCKCDIALVNTLKHNSDALALRSLLSVSECRGPKFMPVPTKCKWCNKHGKCKRSVCIKRKCRMSVYSGAGKQHVSDCTPRSNS